MADQNRLQLLTQLQSVYQMLAAQYGVDQFQFHTPPVTSFLRLHQPEKFGNDLSAIRPAVVDVNHSSETARRLESGVAALGIQGIAPITWQDEHLGSVEFGMAFDQAFASLLLTLLLVRISAF